MLKEWAGLEDPRAKDGWRVARYHQFAGRAAELVRGDLRLGKELVFEHFRADANFQAELKQSFPALASRYKKWIVAKAAPGPLTGSKASALRL